MMHDLVCHSQGMTPIPRSELKEKVLAQFGINREENAAEVLPVVHIPEPHPQSSNTSAHEVPGRTREKTLAAQSVGV